MSRADHVIASVIDDIGPCALRPSRWSPYESLVRAIAHQQLTARAAKTILDRFIALYDGKSFPTARDVLATHHARLRAVGFSRSKVKAIRDIAAHAHAGIVPTRSQVRYLNDEELVLRLTPIYGVGRWTVEMLLIFTLGRLDVMPIDDFGIQCGLRAAYKLRRKPTRADFERITACWQPYRSIGAWYLWRVADRLKRPVAP
ncbi:MAG TPA: DNA-3-methyladenine glycosylase 2 family protein [Burkholderiales bacterium]|nr:DNA-3-methyladenine glycosylase 2 family protein [Burkholderiales bacterium]